MVYAGNTGAGASSTAATIASGGNSTCRGGIADRSAYWTTLIDTRTGTPVAGYGGYFAGWLPSVRQAWTDACVRTAATCESHLLGDGRVVDGTGDI